MVFQEETRREKRKKFLRQRKVALSKMPRIRRKEVIFYNTTNKVAKCNFTTSENGKNRQKQTDISHSKKIENIIIIRNKI